MTQQNLYQLSQQNRSCLVKTEFHELKIKSNSTCENLALAISKHYRAKGETAWFDLKRLPPKTYLLSYLNSIEPTHELLRSLKKVEDTRTARYNLRDPDTRRRILETLQRGDYAPPNSLLEIEKIFNVTHYRIFDFNHELINNQTMARYNLHSLVVRKQIKAKLNRIVSLSKLKLSTM